MRYVVCYDISDDRRREHMSQVLLDYGVRIEESVFECILTAELSEQMVKRIERLVVEQIDRVHVFTLCDACVPRTICLGTAQRADDSAFYVL